MLKIKKEHQECRDGVQQEIACGIAVMARLCLGKGKCNERVCSLFKVTKEVKKAYKNAYHNYCALNKYKVQLFFCGWSYYRSRIF